MGPALAKAVMRAMRNNQIATIKALASQARMSKGKLVSTAKKISMQTKKTKKMTSREKMLRSRKGQDA